MSAPSTSIAEGAAVTLAPGLVVSATGVVALDGRVLARIGAEVRSSPEPVTSQPLAAGSLWHAEQVTVNGRCVLVRLRPRAAAWRRCVAALGGESVRREQAIAAAWGAPLWQVFPWGVVEGGVTPALRGAAVITVRASELPPALPPAAGVFWRRRTPAECRAIVAAAVAAAGPGWRCLDDGVVFADGTSLLAVARDAVPGASSPGGFAWQEMTDGKWRARGEYAGWRFTLVYRDNDGAPALCWVLARLAVADEGPWDPVLEREVHRAHVRWLRGVGPAGGMRAVNDAVARTGAEIFVEWR